MACTFRSVPVISLPCSISLNIRGKPGHFFSNIFWICLSCLLIKVLLTKHYPTSADWLFWICNPTIFYSGTTNDKSTVSHLAPLSQQPSIAVGLANSRLTVGVDLINTGTIFHFGNLFVCKLNPHSTGIDFSHQNLKSVDVRFWRLKSIPALWE